MAAEPPSENVRLLERMYDAWHAGDLPRVLEFLDPEFEWVNPDCKILRIQWFHDVEEARQAAGLGPARK